jgi:integrase
MQRRRLPGKLTDAEIRNLPVRAKLYKISDGGGLFVVVNTNGSKYWRLKYRYDSKEKSCSLGVYPGVTLAEARKKAITAKELLAQGTDPSIQRRRDKIKQENNSFQAIALEWWNKEKGLWTKAHADRVKVTLEKEAFPLIGSMEISKITSQDCLVVVRKVESRGALDVASRIKQRMAAVFRYAIYTGYVNNNPVDALRDVIRSRKTVHQKALDLELMPQFLNDIEKSTRITSITRHALQLLVHVFIRPGELRAAEWSEIDWDKEEWRVPAARMKMREQHIIPLAPQVIDILKSLQDISGNRQFMFPGYHNPRTFMSENALVFAIRKRLNYDATAHGMRTVASTVLNEQGFRPDIIERQLAHSERNKIRAAYNRAQYLQERREMMVWWADHLQDLLIKFQK